MSELDPRAYVLRPASGEGLQGNPAPISIKSPSGRDLLDEVASIAANPFIPAHAGERAGAWNPGTSIYNGDADSLRGIRNALGKARTGLCRIAFVGDSVTAGQGAVIGSEGPATRLRERLQALGYNVGELVWVFNNTTSDSRITRGAWTAGSPAIPYLSTSTIGSALTYTSSVPGTVVEILASTPSGPFSYSIDGGAPVTVPTVGGPGGNNLTVITGLPNTTHTVVIKPTAASPEVYIAALGVRQSTGVVLINAGQSGAKTTDWDDSDWYAAGTVVLDAAPDIAFVELGLNDMWGGGTTATFKSNLSAILQRWKNTRGVPVISVVSHILDAPFASAVYDLADSYNTPLLDLRDRIGATSAETGVITVDGTHFTAAGYAVKARAWADVLAP